MHKELKKLFEEQIGLELYSAYLYMQFATQMQEQDYNGFAHWLNEQTKEEVSHAMYLRRHLLDRTQDIKLPAIDKPDIYVKNPLEAFTESLKHEKIITAKINEMMSLSLKENDFRSHTILRWFVDEQLEEEVKFGEFVTTLERIADSKAALFALDAEMKARVFVDSTPQE